MFAIGRRTLLLAAAATAAGCNRAESQGGASPDDMAIGAADAPITLIEYASVTCGHCATFHAEVWPQLKANYIDTGKVRFIFREFPTDPVQIAVAGFQLARCNGAASDQYLVRIGELFRQQGAIFASGSMAGVRDKFIEIGGAAGLSQEQVMQCIADPAGAERIRRTVEAANRDFSVTGTPTFILNGVKVEDPGTRTYEGMARILDAALAR